MRLTDTQAQEALILLGMARDFENQTVRDAAAMASWHRRIDRLLELFPRYDTVAARYDTPARREARARVERMAGDLGAARHEDPETQPRKTLSLPRDRK